MEEKKIPLLLFRIGNLYFAVRNSIVRTIVELEENNIFPVVSFPDYVAGLLKHNNRVYVLICLAKLLEIHNCQDLNEKETVVIEINGKTWGLIVDEVKNIFEVEKEDYKTGEVNVFKVDNLVVEELSDTFFFNHINIPSLSSNVKEETQEKKTSENEISILLMKTKNSTVGIEISNVLKIEEKEHVKSHQRLETKSLFNKVYLIGERIIKTASLDDIIEIEQSNIEKPVIVIVKGENNKILGLEVEDASELIHVKESERINNPNQEVKFGFFIKHLDTAVPVLSKEFLNSLLEKEGLEEKEEHFTKEDNTETQHFLIITIGDKEFALEASQVERIYKTEDIHLSPYPTKVKAIKGVVTTKKESYFLISLEEILETTIEKTDENRIVVLKTKDGKVALKVSEVNNILEIPSENYFKLEDEGKFLIKGTILDENGKLFEVLNPEGVLAESKNEVLPGR